MNREQRRKLKHTIGNKAIEQANMILKTPDHCSGCKKEFDKKSKEMVSSWMIEVYEEKKEMFLWCPDCYKKVQITRETLKKKSNVENDVSTG